MESRQYAFANSINFCFTGCEIRSDTVILAKMSDPEFEFFWISPEFPSWNPAHDLKVVTNLFT